MSMIPPRPCQVKNAIMNAEVIFSVIVVFMVMEKAVEGETFSGKAGSDVRVVCRVSVRDSRARGGSCIEMLCSGWCLCVV